MPLRRRLSGVLAAAALVPPLVWLGPALAGRLAPSFRDQGDFFYPLKLYTADRLRSGDVPLWNPLSGAGEPWLANAQAGVFYPPNVFFQLPWAGAAAVLFLLFHFGIAAWGMYRFAKQEGVSDSGGLFAAAVFASSGFAASLSGFWNHFGAWAYLPAIATLARSGLRTRGALLALAVLVGVQAMAGSPEVTAVSLLIAVILAIRPRIDPERPWLSSGGRPILRTAGAILLGLALAAWVIVPFGELAASSDRRAALPAADREPGALPAPALVASLVRSGGGPPAYWVPSVWIGPLAIGVALAAFFERERRRLALVLGAFAALGLFVAAAGAPGSWLRAIPPLDRIRYPEKALTVVVFAIAALAGLGLDTLRFRAGGPILRAAFPAFAVAGLLFLLAPQTTPEVRVATAVGLASAAALALGAGRRENFGALLGGVAALALVASYAVAGRGLFRFVPEGDIRRRPPSLDALGNLTGRVLTPSPQSLSSWIVRDASFDAATVARQREALAGYTNLLFGVSTVRTAAALPTGAAAAIAQTIDATVNPILAAGPASARILWSPIRPGPLPSRKVGQIYRGPIAPYRPRLSFVRSYRVEPDPVRAWTRAAAGEVDLAREVLLDRDPSPRPPRGLRSPLLVARLAEDLPERVVAEITTNTAGLLVVTDLFFPGWIAEEDGRRLEMLRADGFFRAVALGPGSHRVTFRYRPLSVTIGAAITAAAVLTILLLALQGEPIRVGRRR